MADASTKDAAPPEPEVTDVFAAARRFGEEWNSTARAVSPNLIEWQCNTWGSGRGRAYWLETANFDVVARVFRLDTSWNWDARDELIVSVPLELCGDILRLIDKLGEEPESWPWLDEDDRDGQIRMAAEVLGFPVDVMADDDDLLEILRID